MHRGNRWMHHLPVFAAGASINEFRASRHVASVGVFSADDIDPGYGPDAAPSR
jgi:hypothetical protein